MIGPQRLAQNWGWVLVRGLIAIAFGILIFAFPAASVLAFVILFAAFAFADGVLVLIAALRFAHPESGRWWWMIVQGIAGIAIGILTWFWPGITAWVLGVLVAAWAIVTGILEIAAAFQLRRNVAGEIFLLIAGVVSVAAGIILAFAPLYALLAWTWIVAIYALIAGISLIALAFRLRSLAAHAA